MAYKCSRRDCRSRAEFHFDKVFLQWRLGSYSLEHSHDPSLHHFKVSEKLICSVLPNACQSSWLIFWPKRPQRSRGRMWNRTHSTGIWMQNIPHRFYYLLAILKSYFGWNSGSLIVVGQGDCECLVTRFHTASGGYDEITGNSLKLHE